MARLSKEVRASIDKTRDELLEATERMRGTQRLIKAYETSIPHVLMESFYNLKEKIKRLESEIILLTLEESKVIYRGEP